MTLFEQQQLLPLIDKKVQMSRLAWCSISLPNQNANLYAKRFLIEVPEL